MHRIMLRVSLGTNCAASVELSSNKSVDDVVCLERLVSIDESFVHGCLESRVNAWIDAIQKVDPTITFSRKMST